jgi:hypothetical protein
VFVSPSAKAWWLFGGLSEPKANEQIERLKQENETLREENEELKKKNEELEKKNDAADKNKSSTSQIMWLWLLLFLFVVGVVRLIFRNKSLYDSVPPPSGDVLPRCPRCGQEHGPDDTVCKNPACRTQF